MNTAGRLIALVLVLLAMSLPTSAQQTTIRLAHWLGDPIHGLAINEFMAYVNDVLAPEGIRVETVIHDTNSYGDRVIAQTAAGVGPDVIFALPYGNFEIQEFLIDLSPYLEKDAELNFNSFFPVVWDIFSYNGATKLLPVGVSPYLMFYNRQHFLE